MLIRVLLTANVTHSWVLTAVIQMTISHTQGRTTCSLRVVMWVRRSERPTRQSLIYSALICQPLLLTQCKLSIFICLRSELLLCFVSSLSFCSTVFYHWNDDLFLLSCLCFPLTNSFILLFSHSQSIHSIRLSRHLPDLHDSLHSVHQGSECSILQRHLAEFLQSADSQGGVMGFDYCIGWW